MGNGTVLTVPQAFELNAALSQQIPRDISGDDAQYWVTHKDELGAALKKALIRQQAQAVILSGKTLADLGRLEFWQEMWKHLDWELNTENLFVPVYPDGFNWLITIPKGMTPNKAYELCKKHFPCWRYTDNLDQAITHNDRDARNSAYVIRVRYRIEADEEHRNWSAKKLWEHQIACITLTERLVLGLAAFLVSGQHLDIENWTYCAGTRYSDGRVPLVSWRTGDRRLHVGWCNSDNAYDYQRARQVVQHQAQ